MSDANSSCLSNTNLRYLSSNATYEEVRDRLAYFGLSIYDYLPPLSPSKNHYWDKRGYLYCDNKVSLFPLSFLIYTCNCLIDMKKYTDIGERYYFYHALKAYINFDCSLDPISFNVICDVISRLNDIMNDWECLALVYLIRHDEKEFLNSLSANKDKFSAEDKEWLLRLIEEEGYGGRFSALVLAGLEGADNSFTDFEGIL